MAERRMFAKSIVLSDAFLDMPMSTRCLYFTLNMFADDDGFVGSPKGIMRQCGATQDDMLILLQKRFVLAFDSGVIVIKHWRINNFLRKDRHTDTTYQEELATLALDSKGAYIEADDELVDQRLTNGQPMVNPDKDSIEKDSIEKENNKKKKRFTPPTVEEVEAYCRERNNNIDAEVFVNFYASKGWLVGKSPMKDWKACVRTWEKNDTKQNKPTKTTAFNSFEQRSYDYDGLTEALMNRR